MTLHFIRSRWHLLHAFQFACNVISAITFFMQSSTGALTGKFCSYLACKLTGVMFLACCVLPDKKPYGNRSYWCKYVRDINGATQRLKATVPDRRVWLPAHACVVIVAVRLDKALKDAHGELKGAKQSPRPCGPLLPKTAPREMKHALKMHVAVCLDVLYRIRILWLYHVQCCTIFL